MDGTLPPEAADVPASPISRGMLAGISLAALMLGMAATIGLERLQYEHLPATYEGLPYNVSAGRPAQVVAYLVSQGARVTAGQPIVTLADTAIEEKLAAQEARLRSLESQLASTRTRVEFELDAQRRALEQQVFETRLRSAEFLKLQFDGEMERTAWSELAREPSLLFASRDLDEGDWIASLKSESQTPEEVRIRALLRLGSAANSEEVATTQRQLCELRLRQLENALAALPAKLTNAPEILTASDCVQQAQAEVLTLRQQKSQMTLSAAHSGIVGIHRKHVGDRVAAAETLVQVVDDTQRFVQLRIDSSRMNDFPLGETFDLVFSNGAFRQGRVIEIQPQADDTTGGIPQLVVRLEQSGAAWPTLPFGSAVELRRKR